VCSGSCDGASEAGLHRPAPPFPNGRSSVGKGGLAAGLPSPPIPLNGVSPTLLAAWPPQPMTKYIPAPSGSRSSLPKSAPDRSDGGVYGGGGMRARTSHSRSPRRPAGTVLDGHRPSNSTATGPAGPPPPCQSSFAFEVEWLELFPDSTLSGFCVRTSWSGLSRYRRGLSGTRVSL